jgi:hypothetical protein
VECREIGESSFQDIGAFCISKTVLECSCALAFKTRSIDLHEVGDLVHTAGELK